MTKLVSGPDFLLLPGSPLFLVRVKQVDGRILYRIERALIGPGGLDVNPIVPMVSGTSCSEISE